jgi:hypothetical protein
MSIFGYLCEVDNPKDLLDLSKKVYHAGYIKFDTYTPFPVHGIDKAMGIPLSRVPYLSLIGCLIGLTGAIALQVWTNGFDYPIALSGKPFVALPAFVPVTFELTILFTAFFTVFGMFAINKLPQWNQPIFNNESIKKATCSGFFLAISSDDKNFDIEKTKLFLERSGGKNIEAINH